MSKTHRLQILIEPEQYRRLEVAAERSGGSIASIVRDAVDRVLPAGTVDRAASMEMFLTGPETDMGDWADEKRTMRDEMSGRS